MTAPAAAPAAPADAPAAPPPAAGAPSTPPPAANVVPPGATVAGTPEATENLADIQQVEKLPKWAQKIITDARTGEAAQRTAAKEAADRTKAILKAAGLETEETDPVKIAAELETERTGSRQARVELAVYRAASATGADPDALLDSRGFLDKVKDLDPSDQAGIRLAISEAIESNPRLKAQAAPPPPPAAPPAPAAGVSGADFTGGTGAAAQQLTREQLAGMSNEEILKAHAEGRLATLTGAKK